MSSGKSNLGLSDIQSQFLNHYIQTKGAKKYILSGSPGSGKTYIIISLIQKILELNIHKEILILTSTNMNLISFENRLKLLDINIIDINSSSQLLISKREKKPKVLISTLSLFSKPIFKKILAEDPVELIIIDDFIPEIDLKLYLNLIENQVVIFDNNRFTADSELNHINILETTDKYKYFNLDYNIKTPNLNVQLINISINSDELILYDLLKEIQNETEGFDELLERYFTSYYSLRKHLNRISFNYNLKEKTDAIINKIDTTSETKSDEIIKFVSNHQEKAVILITKDNDTYDFYHSFLSDLNLNVQTLEELKNITRSYYDIMIEAPVTILTNYVSLKGVRFNHKNAIIVIPLEIPNKKDYFVLVTRFKTIFELRLYYYLDEKFKLDTLGD